MLQFLAGAPREPDAPPRPGDHDAVLFGHGRFGAALATRLRTAGLRVPCIDFNPAELARARRSGFAVAYRDASAPEFVAEICRCPASRG